MMNLLSGNLDIRYEEVKRLDFEDIRQYRNKNNVFARRNGIVIEEIREGYARVRKTITEDDLNSGGNAHGAILFAIADTACGSVAASTGHRAATLNASYNFLRAGHLGDTLIAQARVRSSEKVIGSYEVEITNQDGKLIGTASMNFYIFQKMIELKENECCEGKS